MTTQKKQNPAVVRRVLPESSSSSPLRVPARSGCIDSITGQREAQRYPVAPCPVCGVRRTLGRRLTLSLFGQRYEAEVCPVCHSAAAASAGYRLTVAHHLAQHQHHREVCHAA